jgi:chromosome segregation ATPase
VARDDEMFREALRGKKIPLLTLDHQWHKLFTQTGDNEKLHKLEDNLNDLLKQQGKLNTEIKSLSAYKKKIMQEIVDSMELPDSGAKDKMMSEHKRAIEEANQKISDYNDELLEIPQKIEDANFELMLATMHICYDKIQKNVADIDDINKWIADFRVELKNKIIQKQHMEIWNDELYSYMHAIFGPDVIDMFDMKYNPKNVLNKEKDLVDSKNPKQE